MSSNDYDMASEFPKPGFVHFDSWAGRTKHAVEVLRKGPKRYTVRLVESCFRYSAGKLLHPPHSAVTFA